MKKISIVIPTYNECENIVSGYQRVKKVLDGISNYSYEILFIDNSSTDGTKGLLRKLADEDETVKVIFNSVNVGWMRSSYYGIINTTGDATVLLAADMQEPPEMIPKFIEKYEEGYKIVVGIKNRSKENRIKYLLRQMYYSLLKRIAEIEHIEQFMGFGLYDKSFVDVLRNLNDPMPYLRGIVAELGGNRAEVTYIQEARKKGKTHFNFWGMYDLAMLGITSYTKVLMRVATILGFIVSCGSILIAIITFIMKLANIVEYPVGVAAISIGVFALGGFNLFFVGLLGEYVLNINTRVMNRPLVIEEERLNF